MLGNVGLWPAKTFVWTGVTQDLRNGWPLEMLSIAKPYQTARHCKHSGNTSLYIISPRGPKGAKREDKKINQDAVGAFIPVCFLPCASRSCGRYLRHLACLRSHVLRAYCNFESKRRSRLHYLGDAQIKKRT